MWPTTEKPEGISSMSSGRVAWRISSERLGRGREGYPLSRSRSLGRRCGVVLVCRFVRCRLELTHLVQICLVLAVMLEGGHLQVLFEDRELLIYTLHLVE